MPVHRALGRETEACVCLFTDSFGGVEARSALENLELNVLNHLTYGNGGKSDAIFYRKRHSVIGLEQP